MRDKRLTPARPDLAADWLKGEVEADRFAAPHRRQLRAASAPLHRAPAPDAPLETQLLFGEILEAYEEKDGWLWGQAALDGYVGYAPAAFFSTEIAAPTHRVTALRTYVFSRPDIKSRPLQLISMNAQLAVRAETGEFVELLTGGCVFAAHCAPIEAHTDDYAGIAELFVGTPYLWGGRESLGLDCSGLVQNALMRAGAPCPRDADMQEELIGEDAACAPFDENRLFFRRGDLVFWKGHVGIMRDETHMIHANATHMMTTVDPLRLFAAQARERAGPITRVKRVDLQRLRENAGAYWRQR